MDKDELTQLHDKHILDIIYLLSAHIFLKERVYKNISAGRI